MRHSTFFLFAVLTLVSSSAAANVRAPHVQDSGFVLPKVSDEALAGITLEHENLTIEMPRVERGERLEYAKVTAEYTLSNAGDAFELPLVFLAQNIADPKVTVNGAELPVPPIAQMTPAQQQELDDIHEKAGGSDRGYRKGSVSPFYIPLKAGKNVMRFEYRQQLAFTEHGTGYHAVRYDDGGLSLSYLLYPAKSWNPSPKFELNITVTLPDYKKDGWFWDTYWEPQLQQSLGLKPTYDKESRTTTWRAKHAGLPSDILVLRVTKGKKR